MNKIKQPTQARSIEKKDKILKAGYKLICEKGYYNTNTAEIAKAAGVSSGIVYRYFKDKKDIFSQAVQKEAEVLFDFIFEKLNALTTKAEIQQLLPSIIDKLVYLHHFNEDEFRELKAMSLVDEDFSNFYIALEKKTCSFIADTLIRIGFESTNTKEKAYLIWQLIDNFCDQSILIQNSDLDLDFIYNQTITMVLAVLDA